MAPGHLAYLFDAQRFRVFMQPLRSELDRGEYDQLYQMARESLDKDANTRILLQSFGLSYVYEYYDHPDEVYTPPEPGNCLVALLVPFLRPLPIGSTWGNNKWFGFDLLRESLKLIGWVQNDIDMFVYGKSLCELLSPQHLTDLNQRRFATGQAGDPWCASEPGWVDLAIIQELHHRLLVSQQELFKLVLHPELFLPRRLNRESLQKLLPQQYAHLEHLLTCAQRERHELLVQIVM
jgi:hypothetical protein